MGFGGQIIIANVSLMLNATALDGTVRDSLRCVYSVLRRLLA